MVNSEYQKCPVCDGTGLTSKPPWVAGDVQPWMGTSAGAYPCKRCIGTGTITRPHADAHPGGGAMCDPVQVWKDYKPTTDPRPAEALCVSLCAEVERWRDELATAQALIRRVATADRGWLDEDAADWQDAMTALRQYAAAHPEEGK